MTNPTERARPPLSTYEDLARMVDYAVLAPECSDEQVAKACETARRYRVGRLTVRPADLDLVVQWMQGSGIPIAAAVSYPHAADTTSAKLYAVRDALGRGAKAIETVLSPGKLIARGFRYLESELLQMAQECHRAQAELIVDVELELLTDDLRVIACRVAKRAEVDWVRAGCLFGRSQYAPDNLGFLTARLGELVKVDAGSGVRTLDDALRVYESGVAGFQTTNPAPILESWTEELNRRAAAAATPAGE